MPPARALSGEPARARPAARPRAPQVSAQYVRKIEQIVRKRDASEEAPESASPSPFDPAALVADTALECPTTKNVIPYCVATGRHVVLHDLCVCPACAFPALYSAFARLLDQTDERACPMCHQQVELAAVRRLDEAEAALWLRSFRERSAAAAK